MKPIDLVSFAKGKNDVLPPKFYYKSEGEPDPPGYRRGIDLLIVNVSKVYSEKIKKWMSDEPSNES